MPVSRSMAAAVSSDGLPPRLIRDTWDRVTTPNSDAILASS